MKAVAVIPARWASTRLPEKMVVKICGRPLIEWVVRNVLKTKNFKEVIVATDDKRIAEAVGGLECHVAMTRPDHPSGTDRVAEAVSGVDADVVVNVQGDEPFMDPALVDRLAEALGKDDGWDMSTAAVPIASDVERDNPGCVKVVLTEEDQALYFSRHAIPFVRDAGGESEVKRWRHLGVYGYRRDFLERLVQSPPCMLEQAEKLEQLRALYLGGRIKVLRTSEQGIGIDTPEDVEHAELLMRERVEGKSDV